MLSSGLISFVSRIAGIGVKPGMPAREATRIKATNLVAVGAAIGSCVAIPAMWIAGEKVLSVAVLLPILGYLGCLWLNHARRYSAAKALLVLIIDGGVFFYAVAFGRDAGFQFLFFPGAMLAALVFDIAERRKLAWSVLLPFVLLNLLYATGFRVAGMPAAHVVHKHILFGFVEFMTFVIMLGTIFTLYASYERTIAELQAGQRRLIHASKMTALGELSTAIAHEINNPLAVIQARAAVLVKQAESGKADAASVILNAKQISETVLRIGRIVRALRFISRDGTQDGFERVPVGRLFQETLELCGEKIRERGIRIDRVPVADDVVIDCSPVQISQVILNLLNNSADAVCKLDEKWIRLECAGKDGGVQIRVTDSGNGIPAEVRGRLFTPFFTTKPVGQGTGLGLSISRNIVERHGGTLGIDGSGPNTCMVISLPKASAQGE